MGVVVLAEGLDRLHEVFDVAERAALDRTLAEQSEPALDLTEPRRMRRRAVPVAACVPGQPGLHLGMLVRGVVVQGHMDVEVGRDLLVNEPQEGRELLRAVLFAALRENFVGGDGEGAAERRGAVADAIVRVALAGA